MIRYALLCDEGHAFDAWFRDSDAFEAQNENGDVQCAFCQSHHVRKSIMSPALRRRDASPDRPAPESPPAAPDAPNAVSVQAADGGVAVDDRFRALRAMVRELHGRLKDSAENVGRLFPEEARKIHENEAPARPIYGVATPEEARSLVEDGIDVMPLPPLPEERN